MLSIPKSPIAASIFSGLAGIASIYAGPPGEKEIARVTGGRESKLSRCLPPGAYVLDVQDRQRKHVRAKRQPFTIVSSQTVRVDWTLTRVFAEFRAAHVEAI
jgi:hypothetical protein